MPRGGFRLNQLADKKQPAKDKIAAAQKATEQIERLVDLAKDRIARAKLNRDGIYVDAVDRSIDIARSVVSVQDAIRLCADTKWPTAADYAAAQRRDDDDEA